LKIRKEIKLGILFVTSLFLIIWGINYLKGKDIFTRQIEFYAVYDEVNGLLSSNPVTVSGVKIGQVDYIRFMPDGSGNVLIKAVIDRQIAIPVNSIAYIASSDIFGYKELQIALGDNKRHIQNGDTLKGIFKPSFGEALASQSEPIQEQVKSFVNKLDSIITSVNSILGPDNRMMINNSIQSLQLSLASIENTAQTVDKTIGNESARLAHILEIAESVISNIENNNESLGRIITNFEEISDTLASENVSTTIVNAAEALTGLNNMIKRIEQGEGSAGLLLNDEELYHKLKESSTQLELLLEDIRSNPKKYFNISVFGR
jgi:phospholipid/cholesterol/gamma-HCH transport system substrate-binding protein